MKIFKIILVALIVYSANFSFAQIDNSNKRMRDGIDSIIKQKVMDKLMLDETTADKFINTYKENNKQIRILNKEKNELMESIELDPGANDMDTKLDKMLELESKIVEQRKNFFNELRTFLTPQQIAKTLILRKKFEKEFRKEIQKHRKRDKMNDKVDGVEGNK